jgi:hypothetical protein
VISFVSMRVKLIVAGFIEEGLFEL